MMIKINGRYVNSCLLEPHVVEEGPVVHIMLCVGEDTIVSVYRSKDNYERELQTMLTALNRTEVAGVPEFTFKQ